MLKLAGSICIVAGGAWAWHLQRWERRRKRETLSDFQAAFRRMREAVRMARTPLPVLLNALSADCGAEASAFFSTVSKAAAQGEELPRVWRAQADGLPLDKEDKCTISALGRDLQGDEENVCKAISYVIDTLDRSAGQAERKRPEEEKREAALWFSASALLVILLI